MHLVKRLGSILMSLMLLLALLPSYAFAAEGAQTLSSSPVEATAEASAYAIKTLRGTSVSGSGNTSQESRYYFYPSKSGNYYCSISGARTSFIGIPMGDGIMTLYHGDSCYLSKGKRYILILMDDNSTNRTMKFTLSLPSSTQTTPKIASIANRWNGIQLSWKKVSGATKYQLYRKTGSGKWTRIAVLGSGTTSYVDKQVAKKIGVTYQYVLRAIKGSTHRDSPAKKLCRLSTPVITSVRNNATRSVSVQWKLNTKVSGYQVEITSAGTKRTHTLTGSTLYGIRHSNLRLGRSYTYRVRSYRQVGSVKYYSAWTGAKTVTVRR